MHPFLVVKKLNVFLVQKADGGETFIELSCIFLISNSSHIFSSSIVVSSTVCQTLARNFRYSNMTLSQNLEYDPNVSRSFKTFRSYDCSTEELRRKGGSLKDGFPKDEVL